MNIADYKGIWVFAEQREGKLQKVSLELLGEGKRLANELGVCVKAPTDTLFVNPDGTYYVGERKDGFMKIFYNRNS